MWIDTQTGIATVVGYTHLGYDHAGDIMPTDVKICHRRGNGMYVSITVNLNALPAHLAHGDILPQDGEDCGCL